LLRLVFWLHPQSVFGRFYTNSIVLDFILGVMIGLTHTDIPLQATGSSKVPVACLVAAGIILVLVLPLIFPMSRGFLSRAYQPA
jgi:hypothetical protein